MNIPTDNPDNTLEINIDQYDTIVVTVNNTKFTINKDQLASMMSYIASSSGA